MTRLICYVDHGQKGGWAKIQMQSGDHCWVEATDRRILVKHSKAGMFSVKMYEEKGEQEVLKAAQMFDMRYPNGTPDDMRHPVLKPIVNTVLHCSNLAEVTRILNTTHP